jgi:hypothetical protein
MERDFDHEVLDLWASRRALNPHPLSLTQVAHSHLMTLSSMFPPPFPLLSLKPPPSPPLISTTSPSRQHKTDRFNLPCLPDSTSPPSIHTLTFRSRSRPRLLARHYLRSQRCPAPVCSQVECRVFPLALILLGLHRLTIYSCILAAPLLLCRYCTDTFAASAVIAPRLLRHYHLFTFAPLSRLRGLVRNALTLPRTLVGT